MIRAFLILLSLSIHFSAAAADENWPQFRGADSRGVADNPGLPDTWSNTENVRWKRDIPGRGWSSPIVWQDRVFLTTVINSGETEEAKKGLYFGGNRPDPSKMRHEWRVICLQLEDGGVLWERTVHTGVPETSLHIKNSYASETPVTDGEHVYAYFGNVGLFCFDLEGTEIWVQRMPARKTRYDWGTAASPVLHGERLYVVNDNEEESTLTAYDKRTGEIVWQVKRDEKSNWATPFVWENDQRTEIITPGTGKTRAYDLDGNLLYEFGGASSITIAAPYAEHGLLYVSSGYILDEKKPLFAIRPGASGDISLGADESENEFIAWCQKQAAPYNPTSIVYGDQLYVLLDRGLVASYDARTGEKIYDRKRLAGGRAFTSSPWAYNGKLFFLSEYGTTFVVKAGPEYELLHENELAEDDMCMATPALAGDKLLIRTSRRLYCIDDE